MEGKGFVVGLTLLVVILGVLFAVAVSSGTAPDDAGNADCVSQEYC